MNGHYHKCRELHLIVCSGGPVTKVFRVCPVLLISIIYSDPHDDTLFNFVSWYDRTYFHDMY